MTTIWDSEQPPYVYAFAIEQMRTREERAAALEQVPAHLRDMVRTQVISDLTTINQWAKRVAAGLSVNHVPAVVLEAAAHLGIKMER